MKLKFFLLIGFIGIVIFILFTGCKKETSSSDKIPGSKMVVEKTTEPSHGTPSIFIPENSYEFPTVIDGTQVTHDFIVLNKGDGVLMINRVKTS